MHCILILSPGASTYISEGNSEKHSNIAYELWNQNRLPKCPENYGTFFDDFSYLDVVIETEFFWSSQAARHGLPSTILYWPIRESILFMHFNDFPRQKFIPSVPQWKYGVHWHSCKIFSYAAFVTPSLKISWTIRKSIHPSHRLTPFF